MSRQYESPVCVNRPAKAAASFEVMALLREVMNAPATAPASMSDGGGCVACVGRPEAAGSDTMMRDCGQFSHLASLYVCIRSAESSDAD